MRFGWFQTAYRRPNYQAQVTRTWLNARKFDLIQERAVFLEPSDVVDEMTSLTEPLGEVRLNSTLQGVLVNPWNGFSEMFNRGCEFVIIAEDDVVVSDDVIEYFYWAAHEYRRHEDVYAVTAWSNRGGLDATSTFLRLGFGSPLVWGTWARCWYDFIRDTWDKDYSHQGWDWNLKRLMTQRGEYTVMPRQSRSDHIGEFGGTHMTPDLVHVARGTDFREHRDPCAYRMGYEFDE